MSPERTSRVTFLPDDAGGTMIERPTNPPAEAARVHPTPDTPRRVDPQPPDLLQHHGHVASASRRGILHRIHGWLYRALRIHSPAGHIRPLDEPAPIYRETVADLGIPGHLTGAAPVLTGTVLP